MRISAAGATDIGRIREGNEDSFLIDESLGLYIVCDGMGGHAAGEVASERGIAFAAQYIRDHQDVMKQARSVPGGYFHVAAMIEHAIQFASSQLYEMGLSSSLHRGMGTTMTLLLVLDSKAVMGHVGDSRLYVVRDNTVHQLSTDHTLANEMVALGSIRAGSFEADRYGHVLTRAIGTQSSVKVETLLFDLFPDDVCVLCSDGLSKYVDDAGKIGELIETCNLSLAPGVLIEYALGQGGADNVTAVTISVKSDQHTASEAAEIRQRLKLLKGSFLCRGMSESRAMRLLNHSAVVSGSAGQTLVASGTRDSGAYFVRRGRVIVELPNGTETEVGEQGSFGEAALANGGRAVASATIVADAELQFVSRRRFDSLTKRFPKLGRQLYKNLAFEICSRYCENLTESASWSSDTMLEADTDFESNSEE